MGTSATFKVDGMTCQGCANAVTRAIGRAAPEANVAIDVAAGKVAVTPSLADEIVRKAVEGAGFAFAGRLPG